MSKNAEIVLVHDARAVHDTANLRFGHYVIDGQISWIVATVAPTADSGAATLAGSVQGRLSQKKTGDWKASSSAPPGNQNLEGTYSWLEPIESHKRVTVPEDYYSPFANGGTIIFRYEPAAVGSAQFKNVVLIFSDWAQDTARASDFMLVHPGLLENGEQRAPEITKLQSMLSDKNRFLAVAAFRELAKSDHLDTSLALEQLAGTEPPLDSVFTYLMLTSRGNDGLAEQVKTAIRSSREQRKLRSIALGAFSAMLFRSEDSEIHSRSKMVLEGIRSRLIELNIPLDQNSVLFLVLTKAGVI